MARNSFALAVCDKWKLQCLFYAHTQVNWAVCCIQILFIFLQDPLTYAWLFLSLGFIGYASVFHEVVANHAIDDVEDDQLYYTKIFLDEQKRVSLVF